MELIYILIPIFLFVLGKMVLEHRDKARTDNVRLLEEALKNPALDRATIESLAWQLTGARPPRAGGPGRFLAFLLAIGWIALFTGLGVWVIGEIVNEPAANAAGVLVAVIGFGLVTYPFALRELEARQKA
ncbi:MAG: hypothetical protein FJ265_07550 [Planctomycetes bacterium]|nr:hypothetical protein [Planctomycetota bacterium]